MKKITFLIFFLIPLLLAGQTKNEFEELATGYFNNGKTTQAAEFYSKAGYAYWNKGAKDKAAAAFQKAYDIFSGQGNLLASITVANNIGLIFMDEEKYSNAYTAFNNVLLLSRKTKSTSEQYNALMNVSAVAIELALYKDAIAKASEALVLAKEMNNLRLISKCYALLAESNEKMGNSSDAYKYFELYASVDKKLKEMEMDNVKQMSAEEIGKAEEKKRVAEIELKIKKGELKLIQDSLGVAERLAYEQKMQVELRSEQLRKKEMQLGYERTIRKHLISAIIAIFLFLSFTGFMLAQKLRDNKKLKLQKEEIELQHKKLNVQNKKITDSIHYGLRIQQAMLPNLKALQKKFDAFIIYRPKDIVSGDFYWFYEVDAEDCRYQFVALADCTGHGVPGAFMSMIGYRFMSQTIIEHKVYQPSQILESINCSLKTELQNENEELMDGMDMALCRLSIKNGEYDELVFAGAKRPILLKKLNDEKLELIEGSHKGIGGFTSENAKPFVDKTYKISKGDFLVLYTDGITDQPDINRNRFGTKRFTSIVEDNLNASPEKIKATIEAAFDVFTLKEEQRDDITVMGLRLK
jgi:serine phosphatase RsbU (regulator of sigma subunit)